MTKLPQAIGWLALGALASSAFAQESDETFVEEIVVVGSQIKGAQISDALPVSVLDEDDIEALGINSGDELLEYLAEQGQNLFSEAENISGGVNSARGDIGAFNLRNLGTGNTLVLLNGRRMVNAASYQTEQVGGSFVPVNTVNAQALPITGLRRAEVLKDGASAIYGADAVAGVVNYVLRDDFEGFQVRVRADDYESLPRNDLRLTLEWGQMFNDERTRVGVFVNYYDRDRVNSQDDNRWADSDFRRRLSPDSPWQSVTSFRNDSANSAFGQYDSTGSVAGLGLSGVFTDSSGEFETFPSGDPRCQYELGYGTCGAVDGQGTNRYNLNDDRDLISALKRTNIYAYFNHDFENGMESFTEFTGYLSETNTTRHPSARSSAVAKSTVGAENYYNPFGPCTSPNRLDAALIPDVPCTGLELELDNYRFAQVPRIVDNDGDTFRLVSGLRGNFNEWDWEGALTWSRATKEDITRNRVSNTLLQEALNDPTEAAFNPFGGIEGTNIERALVDVKRENETELRMIDFKMSNAALWDLPAGPVAFLAGFEYREESFEDDRDPRLDGTIAFIDNSGNTFPFISDVANSSPTEDSSGEREVTSVFVELQVPVFEKLDVQLALRYEDFSDVGDTTVGKAAFGYRPIDPLLIRGSWSEAFRAPNLVTVNESRVARQNTRDDQACLFADPGETVLDCSYGIQRTAQGSSALQPEESENWNLGIVFEPWDFLTFTLDYWEIEKTNTIGLFGENNHIALDLLQLIQAGTANCAAPVGNPAVIRGDSLDPAGDALYLAAGICPAGEIVRVDDEYANLDTRTVAGHDIGVYMDFDTGIGAFNFRFNGSFLDKYDQEAGGDAQVLVAASDSGVLPATVAVDGFADLRRQNGNATSKLTASMRWRRDNWGATLTGVRYDDFIQTSLTLSDGSTWKVQEMTTFNTSVDYRFSLNDIDTKVKFGVNNVTDERAPLADRFFGYYADQHNDFGRYYYLDVRVSI